MVDHPAALRQTLLTAGFDSTQADSMGVVPMPEHSDSADPENARRMLQHTVFLPFYEALPPRELEQMASIIIAQQEESAASAS